MACGKTLSLIDLIPVLSWIFLRGRCRHCGSRISIQYPLVELCTGVLFGLVGYIVWGSASAPFDAVHIALTLCSLIIVGVLVMIAVYDTLHTIIPDEWVYLFAGAGLLTHFLASQGTGESILVALMAGPIVASPLFALWLVSRGRWMGLGDPKLALGIGWLLGIPLGFTALFLSFVVGALISVLVFIPLSSLRKGGEHITMKSEVPFGPFLIASTVFVWFASWSGWALELFPWV